MKVRGVRVEPGEVAAVLSRHPVVAEAAVIAIEEPTGGARLAAYVVPRQGFAPITTPALRSFAASELPETSVPSTFVTLDEIPLTTGGKVDRRALRALDVPRAVSAESSCGPSDETEAALVEHWCEIFPGRTIGVDDDFFDLGGHSLLAVRLFARIRQRFGFAPPLSVLLDAPTIRQFALVLRSRPQPVPKSPLIAINAARNGEAWPRLLWCASPARVARCSVTACRWPRWLARWAPRILFLVFPSAIWRPSKVWPTLLRQSPSDSCPNSAPSFRTARIIWLATPAAVYLPSRSPGA